MKRRLEAGASTVPPMFEPHDVGASFLAGLASIVNNKRPHVAPPQPPLALPGGLPASWTTPFVMELQPTHQLLPLPGQLLPPALQHAGSSTGWPSGTFHMEPQLSHPPPPQQVQSGHHLAPAPQSQPQQQPQPQQLAAARASPAPAGVLGAGAGAEAPPRSSSSWAVLQQRLLVDPRPALRELQLQLPALLAEYRAEMRLLLRACQLASSISKHSVSTGSTLLLDPAARKQVQRQVLANCNDKHGAVAAAFKAAASAIAAAAAAAGLGRPVVGGDGSGTASANKLQRAVSTGGGLSLGDRTGSSATIAASAAAAPAAALEGAAAAGEGLQEMVASLQALRASYQAERLAATSALFAICRGFGQRFALSPPASAAIKAALAAAQGQHARVEQLWQDMLAAAGAGARQ